MNDFTQVNIRDVADPLFSKVFYPNTDVNFNDKSCVKHSEWFDSDCINARNIYLNALNVFNANKSDPNRAFLCERKKEYKRVISIKKKQFYRRKMTEIKKFKKCNPKQFWNYFKKEVTN